MRGLKTSLLKFPCRVFSLTWPASMQIYWNKRKRLHEKRVELPEDWFGTPTWPPFRCFGTPIWPPWRHVKTIYFCWWWRGSEKWLRLFSWFMKRKFESLCICTFFIWLVFFFRFFVLSSVFRMWVISQLSTCVPLSKRSMKSSTGEVISTRVGLLAHNAEKNFKFSCWGSAVNTIGFFSKNLHENSV